MELAEQDVSCKNWWFLQAWSEIKANGGPESATKSFAFLLQASIYLGYLRQRSTWLSCEAPSLDFLAEK